jgi:hypothetical protein
MKQFYTGKLILFALTLLVFAFAKAQTQNSLLDAPGDIAIVALHSDDGAAGEEDGFSFILLDNAPAGATIRFIDEEWLGMSFADPIGEGELLWTNDTGSQIAAGTVVNITDSDGPTEAASIGTVDEVEPGFNINGTSDQIYAVTGTRAAPGTFLTFYGTLEAGATLTGTGLTDGATAQVGVSGFLEGRYTGPTTCNGTAAQCAAEFNTTGNWTTGADFTHPTDVPTAYTGSGFVPNNAPELGGTAPDATALVNTATAIDLSAYSITDADGDPGTLTLTADRGTIASIDGNGTTAGVTIANSGTASMKLSGTFAALNSYLNTTSKIEFTTALDDTTTANLTVTPSDGIDNGTADVVAINITVQPSIAFTSMTDSGLENVNTALAEVSLSASSTQTITVDYSVIGTATDGTDFSVANRTLTLLPGSASENITISIFDDSLDELNETVIITLSNPTNASLGTNTSFTYTITDNDATPVVTSGQSFMVNDNDPNTTAVGTVAATDTDAGTTFQNWMIASGNTNSAFSISSSGVLAINDATAIDFGATPSFTLGVTVSDGSNTSNVENVTITVNDRTVPTASNPTALTGQCNLPAQDPLVVTDEADNSGVAPTVAFVSDVSDGNSNPETFTRTYSVTDGAGNSINVQQSIVIEDTTPPTPDLAALPNVTAQCSVTSLVYPTATDNCGGMVAVTNNATLPITAQGTTVVTWSYDDGNGNVSTQQQNVIIDDLTAPGFIAAATTLNTVPPLNGGNGSEGTAFQLVSNKAITISGFNVALQNRANQNLDVWYTNTDLTGPPTITTSNGWILYETISNVDGLSTGLTPTLQEITLNNPLSLPTGTYRIYIGCSTCAVVYTTFAPTNPDNFTDGTITLNTGDNIGYGGTVPSPRFHPRQFNGGVIYSEGTSTNGQLPTDLVEIVAECEVTTLPTPSIIDNCGGNVAITNDATLPITTQGTTVVTWSYDDGNGNVSTQTQNIIIKDTTVPIADVSTLADITAQCSVDTLVAPTATDNCGGTITTTNDATLPITTQGTTVVTWSFDDGNGNVSTQTQNVVINDTTAPVADIVNLADVTAQCSVDTLVAPTATDNCGGTVTVTTDATLPITTQGITVVTWSYDDGNGNVSTQTQNVILDDVNAPVADSATLVDLTAECEITNLVPPTATDNCASVVTVTNDATLPITTQGTTVITWSYDDGNGNITTQTQNAIIEDLTAPVPDVVTLVDVTTQCSVTTLVAPTATDNCAGMVTVTNDATFPITAQGTTVVTWSYDDGNGNVITQTQNVVIDDVTAPVPDVVILADVTAECTITALVAPTAIDNCAGVVTVTSDAILPITAQGTTVVTWSYDDGNGNVSTQTQNIVIDDVTAPVPDIATLDDVSAQCSLTTLVAPTASDNCVGTVTVTNDAVLPIEMVGTTIVTWTYDDGNGNATTQTQNVIIAGSDIINATLADAAFVYDGSVRSLAVENIPADATVTYTNNDQTEAGTYVVIAVITSSSADCPQVTIDGVLTIEQAEQTITFDALTRRRLSTDPNFQLTATSSSGLDIEYSSVPLTTPDAATISATGFVTLQAEGFVEIIASQSGNNNYLPAMPVSQELEVYLNSNTTIESITINGEVFNSPGSDIYYLIDCDNSLSSVDVEVNSTTGATFSTGSPFTVATATPGLYRRTIIVTAENGRDTSTFNLLIEKRFVFDAIVEQKYGNTLVVNNNPSNNGGYSFVAYQWFKNGRLVSTKQFFSEGDNASDQLDPSATYMVRMTQANGDVLQTCESTISLGNKFSFTILQNPVLEKTLKLRADFPEDVLSNAQYNVFDQNGRLIKSIQSSERETNINLPDNLPVGVYRVILQTGGQSRSINFINK